MIDEAFDWEGDRPLGTPWHDTVIYEVHVKGFTKQLESVREDLRGTYAGLASGPRSSIPTSLGVTVELLPVHHIADEQALADKGADELLGLQLDRLPGAARGLRGDRLDRRPGARVQRASSRRCTGPGSR